MFEHVTPSRPVGVNQVRRYAVAAMLVLTLGACAAGSTDAGSGIAVFVLGFWHGLIAPVTLLVEVINEFAAGALPWSPRMYQEGAGVVYDIGFFIGIIAGPSILWTGSLRRR
jgi:hypothetical protein